MWSYSRFKEYIDSKDITENQIKKNTGVYESVFTKWKKGICKPKYETLKPIAEYIGVSIERIMEG